MGPSSPPTLAELGQLYVTQAAGLHFLKQAGVALGIRGNELERARKEATTLLLDARELADQPGIWHVEVAQPALAISAIVERVGRVLVVASLEPDPELTARPLAPPPPVAAPSESPATTLGQSGQLFVTYTAAQRFLELVGEIVQLQPHELERARRLLTELLIDARQIRDTEFWRTRRRSTGLDINAIVEREGRLLIVPGLNAQAYAPPSRPGSQRRNRPRFAKRRRKPGR